MNSTDDKPSALVRVNQQPTANLAPVDASAVASLPEALRALVERNVRAFRAENTIKAYQSDWKAWEKWFSKHILLPQTLDVYNVQPSLFPAQPIHVAAYVSWLDEQGYKFNTILRRLATISRRHTVVNAPNPVESGEVSTALGGISRRKANRVRRVDPVVRDDLVKMLSHVDTTKKGKRDRALLLIGWAGAFRASELAAIDYEDIAWFSEGIVVTVRKSKTDQQWKGVQKPIQRAPGSPLCPVAALEAWLNTSGITMGAVFRSVTKHDTVRAQRVTRAVITNLVKSYAEAAGLDPKKVASHSLRAGHVTQGFEDGVPVEQLMGMTKHTKLDMLLKYRRMKNPFAGASSGLLAGKKKEK